MRLQPLNRFGRWGVFQQPAKDGQTWPWLTALLQRRPYSVAVAAVANKPARTIWAVLARGQAWRPGHGRPCIDGIEETTALKESKRPRE